MVNLKAEDQPCGAEYAVREDTLMKIEVERIEEPMGWAVIVAGKDTPEVSVFTSMDQGRALGVAELLRGDARLVELLAPAAGPPARDRCPECLSDDVQVPMWVQCKDGEVLEYYGLSDLEVWCPHCEEHYVSFAAEEGIEDT